MYFILDPDKLNFPLLKKPIHFFKDRAEAPKLLQDTVKIIEAADAFITVTAEYNHSMPPALTNMIDHFPISAYKYRPAGIVCYSAGSFGGVRAAMQARMLHGEIGTPTVQSLFAIPQIQHALSPEGEPLNEHMDKGADKLITELSWYAQALKNHREAVGIPK